MTYEEFKAICLTEYPKIEAMVKTVKALGVYKVSCDVYADGRTTADTVRTIITSTNGHVRCKYKDPLHCQNGSAEGFFCFMTYMTRNMTRGYCVNYIPPDGNSDLPQHQYSQK